MDLGNSPRVHSNKPRGRPPLNYVWDGEHGYAHIQTGALFDRDVQQTVLRAQKTIIERRRYWDPAKDVRARRILRRRAAIDEGSATPNLR